MLVTCQAQVETFYTVTSPNGQKNLKVSTVSTAMFQLEEAEAQCVYNLLEVTKQVSDETEIHTQVVRLQI